MRRVPLASAAAAILLAARPAASQDPDSAANRLATSATTFANSYRTYNFWLGHGGEVGEQDLFFTAGRAYLWGARGGWTLRGGLGAGVSFWGTVRDIGALLGGRLGLVRTWTGDYLDIGAPTELYAVVDGGAYVAWNMEETPSERSLIPIASVGAGLRFRGERELATLELLWEERIGAWAPRLVWRLGIHMPRGDRPRPASARL